MTNTQLIKVAQSIFNRTGRTDSAIKAEALVIEIIANWDAAVAQYGISDEFELVEAIALSVVKAGK